MVQTPDDGDVMALNLDAKVPATIVAEEVFFGPTIVYDSQGARKGQFLAISFAGYALGPHAAEDEQFNVTMLMGDPKEMVYQMLSHLLALTLTYERRDRVAALMKLLLDDQTEKNEIPELIKRMHEDGFLEKKNGD